MSDHCVSLAMGEEVRPVDRAKHSISGQLARSSCDGISGMSPVPCYGNPSYVD